MSYQQESELHSYGYDSKDPHEEKIDHDPSKLCVPCKETMAAAQGTGAMVALFFSGETWAGIVFDYFITAVICMNIVFFIIRTEPYFQQAEYVPFFQYAESVAIFIFTCEYIGRLYAARSTKQFDYSLKNYFVSFYGIVDFVAIAPYYLTFLLPAGATSTTFVRVFRVFRVFKSERYLESFQMFCEVIKRNKALLSSTCFAAFGIWIIFSCIFYLTESDNPLMHGAFDNMPNALFYMAIIMGGEWIRVDFTLQGRIIGVFMCLIGIAVYSIPVSILSAGFEQLATERAAIRAKLAGSQVHCDVCGRILKHYKIQYEE